MCELAERRGAATWSCALEHALRGQGDDPCVAVVCLHELLHRETHTVHEPELLSDFLLVGEGQSILLSTCTQVKQVANAPQHLSGRPELLDFAR